MFIGTRTYNCRWGPIGVIAQLIRIFIHRLLNLLIVLGDLLFEPAARTSRDIGSLQQHILEIRDKVGCNCKGTTGQYEIREVVEYVAIDCIKRIALVPRNENGSV